MRQSRLRACLPLPVKAFGLQRRGWPAGEREGERSEACEGRAAVMDAASFLRKRERDGAERVPSPELTLSLTLSLSLSHSHSLTLTL
eukprot:3244532-Rhodomonas_salina.1